MHTEASPKPAVKLREARACGAASSSSRPAAHPTPEVALLLSTYQKPWHLRRVLASIAAQERISGRVELVVTDDGSTDETADIVAAFARSVSFPVRMTTHPHDGFQLARCRNEGVAASTAPYLLFLDGDCILPPDHVWQHLAHRRAGEVMGGYCVRLDQQTSERIDEQVVRSQAYLPWIARRDLRQLALRDWKARWYRLIRHPRKPKLAGGNIGLWRADYEQVNGYDENFLGWGGEDDDLRRRLAASGVRINSILRWTRTFHLWHPPEPTVPRKTHEGCNFSYLTRRGALVRCRRGLVKRTADDLNIRLADAMPTTIAPPHAALASLLARLKSNCADGDERAATNTPAEVEVALHPGHRRFRADSQCRLLVVLDAEQTVPRALREQADIIVADYIATDDASQRIFPLSQLDAALKAVA